MAGSTTNNLFDQMMPLLERVVLCKFRDGEVQIVCLNSNTFYDISENSIISEKEINYVFHSC